MSEKKKKPGRPARKKEPEKIADVVDMAIPVPSAVFDRLLRYARNPGCPECASHPIVCMMRRRDYRKYRCRNCGHIFEVHR